MGGRKNGKEVKCRWRSILPSGCKALSRSYNGIPWWHNHASPTETNLLNPKLNFFFEEKNVEYWSFFSLLLYSDDHLYWNYAPQDLVKTSRFEWTDKFFSRFFFRLLRAANRPTSSLARLRLATTHSTVRCPMPTRELRLEEMRLKGPGIVQKGWFLLISSASDGILETCLWWYWDHLLMDFWFDRNWSLQIQRLFDIRINLQKPS